MRRASCASAAPRPAYSVLCNAHRRSLGADAMLASNLDEFRMAMVAARAARKTQVIVINTTHTRTTDDGGCWWDVAIPEVSQRAQVVAARQVYDTARKDKSS